MNKFFKAGLLIVTLVIPALVFTFLRFFATNHYDLPFYHPVTDSEGRVVISNGDTLFAKLPVVNLKTVAGEPFKFTGAQGKVTVVSYLPDTCDDTSKIVLSQLDRVFSLRNTITDLNLLSITKDDSTGKPQHLSLSGKRGWEIGGFESRDEDRVLFKDFQFQTKVPKSKTNSLETKLILVDGSGYIRGYYNGADKEETDRLMAEIKILDYEKHHTEQK